MTSEQIKLFNYKGYDIFIKEKGKKYHIGIRGQNQLDMWFESIQYDCLKTAALSGREYARIIIDKMILAQKEDYEKNRTQYHR